MLQKQYRLPASTKLINATSYTSPLFYLKTANNTIGNSRFGFVISKKTASRATARNRIRRVFRSCIEEMREELKSNLDFLFVLKVTVLEIERKELYNELHKFFSEKHLLQ